MSVSSLIENLWIDSTSAVTNPDGQVRRWASVVVEPFLKMNIEGAEPLAIAGMSETIAKTLRICISCHDFLADEAEDEQLRTKAELIIFLTRQGFEIETRSADPRPYIPDTVYGFNGTYL